MIVVRAWWNTDHNGKWVDAESLEPDDPETPQSIYGPFSTMDDAVDWMTHGYPDDDTDVWEMDAYPAFEIPEGWCINHPNVIFNGFTPEWRAYLRARRKRQKESREIHAS